MQEQQQSATQRAVRNTTQLAMWTVGWLATLALASFGPKFIWAEQPVIGWIAIAVNLAVGIGWIVAHARYLRGVDELQRKVMLDAVGVAVGVGLVGGFAYAAAKNVGLISFETSEIAIFSAGIAVVYMIAIALGNLRYR